MLLHAVNVSAAPTRPGRRHTSMSLRISVTRDPDPDPSLEPEPGKGDASNSSSGSTAEPSYIKPPQYEPEPFDAKTPLPAVWDLEPTRLNAALNALQDTAESTAQPPQPEPELPKPAEQAISRLQVRIRRCSKAAGPRVVAHHSLALHWPPDFLFVVVSLCGPLF
jgi:hypothetical protein